MLATIIFGCFVIVNMTVGVVCDTFADIKNESLSQAPLGANGKRVCVVRRQGAGGHAYAS